MRIQNLWVQPHRQRPVISLTAVCLFLVAGLSLFSEPSQAGDVVAFRAKAKEVISCQRLYVISDSVTELSTPLLSKIQKQAEYDNFLAATVHDQDAKFNESLTRDQVIALSKSLKTEIAGEIQKNPASGASSLLRLLSQPSADFRSRKQAAEMLALLPLSDLQFSQFQKSISDLYGKMEIISLNPKLESQLRYGDPGENSKAFAVELKTFSLIVKNSDSKRFQEGLSFLSKILERLIVDGPSTKDPGHMETMVRNVIEELAITEDETKFSAVDQMLTQLGQRHVRAALPLISSFDFARLKAGLPPEGLKELSKDVYNQLANQFEKITQVSGEPNQNLRELQNNFSEILSSMLRKGLISETSLQAPISQLKSLVNRFSNLQREFRLKDKILIHSYVSAISDFGKKLNAEEANVMFTLTEKLFADAEKAAPPANDEAAVAFGKDTLLKDTIKVMNDLVVAHSPDERALMTQISTSPHVNDSTRWAARDYLR